MTPSNSVQLNFKQVLIFFWKGIVGMGVLYLGYRQVSLIHEHWVAQEISLQYLGIGWIVLSFFMMPVNWGIEIIKWRYLLSTIGADTWSTSFKGVITGIALSIVTPLKLGEYLGRGAHYPYGRRTDALGLNLISTLSHIWVVVFAGLVILTFKAFDILSPLLDHVYLIPNAIFGGLAILCIGIILIPIYINFSWIKLSPRFATFLPTSILSSNWIALYRSTWKRSLLWSGLRYSVYLHQFLFLLWGMQIDLSWQVLAVSLVFMYFIQTGVPLPSFLTFVIRGEVLLWILSPWGQESVGILLASYMQWLFNLGIPAIIGLWEVIRFKSRHNEPFNYKN